MVEDHRAVAHGVEGAFRYRFQVDLNWKRSEYYFVLNVAVLVAGIGLLATSGRVPRWIIGAFFVVAALLAGLSILANVVQHGYYRSARDEVKRLREELDLPDTTIATTPGLGSKVKRLGRVRNFQITMLSALLLADFGGAVYSFEAAIDRPEHDVQILARIRWGGEPQLRQRVRLVLSRDGEVRASVWTRPGRFVALGAPNGDYTLSTFARGTLCTTNVTVIAKPLQRVELTCPT